MAMPVKISLLLPVAALLLSACALLAPPVREATVAEEAQPEAEPEPTHEAEAKEFMVSEEVYTKTFDEIEEFIRNLNEIIRREDYETWLAYLSDDYASRTSDPEYLKAQSEKPLLKQNNITLRSLKDYFSYVVVPSRVQAKLDTIEFMAEDQVHAYTIIKDTRALLFLLVREDGMWKIGFR